MRFAEAMHARADALERLNPLLAENVDLTNKFASAETNAGDATAGALDHVTKAAAGAPPPFNASGATNFGSTAPWTPPKPFDASGATNFGRTDKPTPQGISGGGGAGGGSDSTTMQLPFAGGAGGRQWDPSTGTWVTPGFGPAGRPPPGPGVPGAIEVGGVWQYPPSLGPGGAGTPPAPIGETSASPGGGGGKGGTTEEAPYAGGTSQRRWDPVAGRFVEPEGFGPGPGRRWNPSTGRYDAPNFGPGSNFPAPSAAGAATAAPTPGEKAIASGIGDMHATVRELLAAIRSQGGGVSWETAARALGLAR